MKPYMQHSLKVFENWSDDQMLAFAKSLTTTAREEMSMEEAWKNLTTEHKQIVFLAAAQALIGIVVGRN